MSREPTPEGQKPGTAKGTLNLVAETLGGAVGSFFSGVRTIVIGAPIIAIQFVYNSRDPETERMLKESQQQNREYQRKIEEKEKRVSCLQMSMIVIVLACVIVVIAVLLAVHFQ